MAHALCMIDNLRYTRNILICNINCFSTANIVARTRTNTRNTEEVQRKQRVKTQRAYLFTNLHNKLMLNDFLNLYIIFSKSMR